MIDRRDNRPSGRHGSLIAKLDAERWERNRQNSANVARWERCQLDPCLDHGHGPSTPCRH